MTAVPSLEATAPERIDVALVCGGRFHDFDFVRYELLGELQAWPTVRTQVFSDFAFLEDSTTSWRAVISYTCDVRPSAGQQAAARAFVAGGGRWVALHATNSVLEQPTTRPGVVSTPNTHPDFFDLLGSRFLAHPPVHDFTVYPIGEHPITQGLTSFQITDELYCSEIHPPIEVLLATDFAGECPSFAEQPSEDVVRPLLYLKRTGAGAVCYLALGHCRGLVDLVDLPHIAPAVDRGPWEDAPFRLILSRMLAWAVDTIPV